MRVREPHGTPPRSRDLRSRLASVERLALYLDYDGTLMPIAATPDAARPDAPLLDLLGALAAHPRVAQTAIVSGRSLANLRELLDGVPGLSFVGTHGAEIAPAGRSPAIELFDRRKLEARLAHLREVARELADPSYGFLLEDKGLAIAFHYRLAPPEEGLRRADAFACEAQDPLFDVIRGKMVVEARPRGADKGAAVRALLRLAPRPPEPLPVYFGDDAADEDAFRALEGRGLTALVAHEPRETAALFRLDDPAAVRALLRDLC